MQTLHNGKLTRSVSLEDRGWSLGEALFETLLVQQGNPVWLEEHLARLARGCERLQFDFPARALRDDIHQLLSESRDDRTVLRLCLSGDSLGVRGYGAVSRTPHRYCQLAALAPPVRQYWDEGIRAFVAKTRLPELVELAGIKHSNRLPHVLARAERKAKDFPEGLMLSASGLVVEGIASNCFIAVNGELKTPLLDRAGVEGIVRQKVIEVLRTQGVTISEARLTLSDIEAADELFFCNSLIGLWPARQLDCLSFSSFSLCQRVQKELESVWYV